MSSETGGTNKAGSTGGARGTGGGEGGASAEKFSAAMKDAKSKAGVGKETSTSDNGTSAANASSARDPATLRVASPQAASGAARPTPSGYAPGVRPKASPKPLSDGPKAASVAGSVSAGVQYAAGAVGAHGAAVSSLQTARYTAPVSKVMPYKDNRVAVAHIVASEVRKNNQIENGIAASRNVYGANVPKLAGTSAALAGAVSASVRQARGEKLTPKEQADAIANAVKGFAAIGESGINLTRARASATRALADGTMTYHEAMRVGYTAVRESLVQRGVSADIASRAASIVMREGAQDLFGSYRPANAPIPSNRWSTVAKALGGVGVFANGVQNMASVAEIDRLIKKGEGVSAGLRGGQTVADVGGDTISIAQLSGRWVSAPAYRLAAAFNLAGLGFFAARNVYESNKMIYAARAHDAREPFPGVFRDMSRHD